MTLSINGNDIGEIVEIAVHRRQHRRDADRRPDRLSDGPPAPPRPRAPQGRARRDRTAIDPAEAEELWRLVDRMEARLEVLERALADQIERPRSAATRNGF